MHPRLSRHHAGVRLADGDASRTILLVLRQHTEADLDVERERGASVGKAEAEEVRVRVYLDMHKYVVPAGLAPGAVVVFRDLARTRSQSGHVYCRFMACTSMVLLHPPPRTFGQLDAARPV